jgi:uncharacterized protein
MTTRSLSAGLSLKSEHFDAALAATDEGLWFEVHPENYMVDGGPRLAWLAAIAERHPVSLHGVAMSLAGDDPLDVQHLARFVALVRRIKPALVSEHLAWSRTAGSYLPDLLPFARTTQSLQKICAHVSQFQDALRCVIALENPSHYLRIDGHEWDEQSFLAEIAQRTGCGLLLDVNNVFVSAVNMSFDAAAYIDSFPAMYVQEIHLAGHTPDPQFGAALLVDSHDANIAPEVWALYERLINRIGPRPTLIERDGNVPEFATLMQERSIAQRLLNTHQIVETEC